TTSSASGKSTGSAATTESTRATSSTRSARSTLSAVLCRIKTFSSTASAGVLNTELLIDELLDLFTVEVEIVAECGLCCVSQNCNRFGGRVLSKSRNLKIGRRLCCEFFLLILLVRRRRGRLLYLKRLRAASAET